MSAGRSTADVFGAKVNLSMPNQGMYLVIGATKSPSSLILSVGGQVVFTVPNSLCVIALLQVTEFLGLKSHRDIAHIGPVTIDQERFNRFVELIQLHNKAEMTRRGLQTTTEDEDISPS